MRETRPKWRTTALGSAGVLITATLISGAVAAPASGANTQAGASRQGQDRASVGAAIAAARAAKAGIDWADCPADWGIAKPVQCGWVSVPLDYTKPNGKQIKLAVDHIGNTGTKAERQGALVYNPGGPGASGMRFPSASRPRTRSGPTRPRRTTSWASTRAVSATPRPSPAWTRRSS